MKNFDRIIILHGCPPSEKMVTPKDKRWMNWLEQKLKEKGFDAIAPDLPISWNPKYTDWKKEFEMYSFSKNSMFVGHSCGGAFMVRYLHETGKKIKKLILVAPAKVPVGDSDTRRDLYDFELPIDGSKIADEIVLFISNDFTHHLKSQKLYTESLNPRVIKLENKFHFLFFQMKTNEFPELLEEVLK
ncbi:hypothetical protein A2866_00220 [Candidatus Roizmanbacteria bacterium RIFCSPHIGHO2_01_FULL_39_8]|uniref:Alpha/beta hydrolase n=3 Tax=Candidatus Roizmaniibacteriota TaxID=1752723 RepID=A0A1F7GHV4_9BACT|nr:MAG: hypothetical protein A2866_00220 [Candidatus Roizmanbacteria bacterium RIFCSPHIGHO2_01_FULL_39_8]OGK28098.1 MAG: hypothetical protein A3C28_04975 [Candidatus Roizmanbacteria bacterium RIFCSPHIGHO2_02_FULL_39_9]OGK35443.1 MAG: hypothetical protein A3F60_04155 [Candidatus Roizmanbacteria bacterium RIFCSPHIGHO2_12_FULL_39_8]